MSLEVISRFRGCPVLVVGDLMLDEFVWGQVTRISPEAPVPVVEVRNRTWVAGGAANTASNIAALGGRPIVAGLVGEDSAGDRVCQMLQAAGVDTDSILHDDARPTTTKTRVVAHNQQVVRFDQEAPAAMADAIADELLAGLDEVLPIVKACVVSDYGKGVVTPRLCQSLLARCRSRGIAVIVDPKGLDYRKYRGATLVKPNLSEAARVLHRDLPDADAVRRAGWDLIDLLGSDAAVLITQGAQGMTLFEAGRSPVLVPAMAREVYDVTGAGDTVAGTIALALAAGTSLEIACRIAAVAAGIVVGKVGTATVSLDELSSASSAPLRQAA